MALQSKKAHTVYHKLLTEDQLPQRCTIFCQPCNPPNTSATVFAELMELTGERSQGKSWDGVREDGGMCAPSHNGGIHWRLSSHTRASLSCITNMDMALIALHEKKKHGKHRVPDNGGVLAWETKRDKGIHLG